MHRSFLLPLALLLTPLTGCFSSPLSCELDFVGISGNVTDQNDELLAPQAAASSLRHSPDGCLSYADLTVVGPGGSDCELRAIAETPRPEGGLWVTSLRVTSSGDCGWPTTVNGSSTGGAGSWVELDGEIDILNGNDGRACATGEVHLEVQSTLSGNSTATLAGTYRFTSGIVSVEDQASSCPAAAGDDDDSAGGDDDDHDSTGGDDDDSADGDDDDSAR